MQIELDELHAVETETPRRGGAKLERCTRQIRADDQAVCASQIQSHLAGPATEIHDSRITRYRAIEKAREFAAPGPRAQPFDAVVRWITWKGSFLVETANDFCARIRDDAEIRDSGIFPIRRAASGAGSVRSERPFTRRTRE
jgi:hypothetical protein